MKRSASEERQLMALAASAFDARGTEGFLPACEAIVTWHQELVVRRAQRDEWRQSWRLNELVALMRLTDPDRLMGRNSGQTLADAA